MQKNSIPDIWNNQEKLLHTHKVFNLALGLFSCAMLIALVMQFYRNPIVVIKSNDGQSFYPTERKRASIEKEDVESFTKHYLESLYVWSDFNTDKFSREIAPFSDENLIAKVTAAQGQKFLKELKGKKLEQSITFVKVEVQNDKVVTKFDRVLKIEGIPLIIPTETTLTMVQGSPTRMNPMGIYVSGITESEGAH